MMLISVTLLNTESGMRQQPFEQFTLESHLLLYKNT